MPSGDAMTRERPALDWFGAKLNYPMFIVTMDAGGERSGCLVGFATQCSVHPVRFATFISNKNHTYGVALRAEALAVHVVPPDALDLAELFGGETGDEVDKFARCEWTSGPLGSPILQRCPNWCEGPIVASLDAGDHACFVIEPHHGESEDGVVALSYDTAKSIEPGHET
jgi:flavin reductase (DIM6/NTAB) family NADH-FMN oxidoreductase RutF